MDFSLQDENNDTILIHIIHTPSGGAHGKTLMQ